MRKRKTKKMGSILCMLLLLVSLVGCQNKMDLTDYSNTTLTGKVAAIDGTVVALQLGELSEDGMQAIPDMPSNNAGGQFDTLTSADDNSGGMGQPGGGQTPPDMPSDNGGMGQPGGGQTPPDMPSDGDGIRSFDNNSNFFNANGETAILDISGASIAVESEEDITEGSLSDITVDTILMIEVGDHNNVTSVTVKTNVMPFENRGNGSMFGSGQPGGGAGGFGGSGEVTQGTSANSIDADGTYSGDTYTSTGDDENALRVTTATVALKNITVNKESGATSNTEDGDFYGMNAALLATDGATVTITDATVNSSAQNGNGVFSYGEGTTVHISDSIITTTADNSGGIQTTGGGTTNAENLTVDTSGNSSAAIRSDRGGGTVTVNGGTYTSNGYNSPAIYSTAAITVKNATLTANNSEALVIEGKNSITLENCQVQGNMSDTKGSSSDINVHNVMIYQSMSGDADVGTSSFSMTGGKLTSQNGDLFYVTNTHCLLKLSNVEIVNQETDGYFLLVSGNDASYGWGTAGANGAQTEFTADAQTFEGDIAVDSISTLDMTLTNGSSFTGSINIIENEAGGTTIDNNAVITIENGCTWTLTGDCSITTLTNNGTINFNGHTITLADGTILTK